MKKSQIDQAFTLGHKRFWKRPSELGFFKNPLWPRLTFLSDVDKTIDILETQADSLETGLPSGRRAATRASNEEHHASTLPHGPKWVHITGGRSLAGAQTPLWSAAWTRASLSGGEPRRGEATRSTTRPDPHPIPKRYTSPEAGLWREIRPLLNAPPRDEPPCREASFIF